MRMQPKVIRNIFIVRISFFTGIARKANQHRNYDRSDCYGKIAMYTNLLAMAFGIIGYAALFILYEMERL